MPIEGVEEILKSELGLSYIKYIESKHSFISDGRVYDVGAGNRIFVKVNGKYQARRMFEGELDSIEELSKLNLLRLPKPIKLIDLPRGGAAQVLEYIEMVWLTAAQNVMGEQLARLHLDNHNKMKRWKLLENFVGAQSKDERPVDKFGYHTTTCCGYLPQYTEWENDWASFYTKKLDNRISYVVQRDGDREVNELWTNILRGIPKLFSCINVKPSLLHGDFWKGNSGQTLTGDPGLYVRSTANVIYGRETLRKKEKLGKKIGEEGYEEAGRGNFDPNTATEGQLPRSFIVHSGIEYLNDSDSYAGGG